MDHYYTNHGKITQIQNDSVKQLINGYCRKLNLRVVTDISDVVIKYLDYYHQGVLFIGSRNLASIEYGIGNDIMVDSGIRPVLPKSNQFVNIQATLKPYKKYWYDKKLEQIAMKQKKILDNDTSEYQKGVFSLEWLGWKGLYQARARPQGNLIVYIGNLGHKKNSTKLRIEIIDYLIAMQKPFLSFGVIDYPLLQLKTQKEMGYKYFNHIAENISDKYQIITTQLEENAFPKVTNAFLFDKYAGCGEVSLSICGSQNKMVLTRRNKFNGEEFTYPTEIGSIYECGDTFEVNRTNNIITFSKNDDVIAKQEIYAPSTEMSEEDLIQTKGKTMMEDTAMFIFFEGSMAPGKHTKDIFGSIKMKITTG